MVKTWFKSTGGVRGERVFEAACIREAGQGSKQLAGVPVPRGQGRTVSLLAVDEHISDQARSRTLAFSSPLLLSLLAADAAGRHDRSPRPWRQRRQILTSGDQEISSI